jgi:glycosyltransferase involved in cell wall biosynthesis
MKFFIGRGKRIGFPIFELDTFTGAEKHHLSGLDELFVCSNWALKVACDNGIRCPKSVVPLGVDRNIFNPTRSNRLKGKTVFFNCGKWEVRKGHPEIAQAFNMAFTPKDDVELWMMCENPFYNQEIKSKFENMFLLSPMGRAGKIKLLPRVDTHLQVAKIMGAATIGVFPAKAEGWNLELLEMMAMGKYVIATNYAGHTEFCNDENAALLESTGLEPAKDGIWFHGQGNWSTFSIDDLAAIMKQYHIGRDHLDVNEAGVETGRKFSWENSARKLLEYAESD